MRLYDSPVYISEFKHDVYGNGKNKLTLFSFLVEN